MLNRPIGSMVLQVAVGAMKLGLQQEMLSLCIKYQVFQIFPPLQAVVFDKTIMVTRSQYKL